MLVDSILLCMRFICSDHYLPPINDTGHHNLQNPRIAQRSHSLIPGNDLDNRFGENHSERKVSLQDGSRRLQLTPYEQRTTFHKEGNAEWMIIHNGNGLVIQALHAKHCLHFSNCFESKLGIN